MPTYVITGANRGLGLEFVRQLSLDEFNTILACVRTSSCDLRDLKSAASKSTHILTCDVSSLDSIKSFISSASKILEGAKIDYLFNNAGINSVPRQTSLSIDPSDLHENILINVLGPAKVTQHLLGASLLSPSVRITNIFSALASMHNSLTISPRRCGVYSISKAALNALTVQQSGDVREKLPGAVVVCMDPGWVRTRMGTELATLMPEESVRGMLGVVHGLSDEGNGKSFCWSGGEVPW